jgi:alpha-mannosidase
MPQANSLCAWDNPSLTASACYWVPQRGLILRLLNAADQPASTILQAGFQYRRIHEVNFLEESVAVLEGTSVTIGPRDVKTWLFEV